MDAQRVVAIGGSAGAMHAIERLLAALPADFPAALLITVHIAPTSPRMLAGILGRAGKLPAAFAEDGAAIEAGHIYIAPPDLHMVARDGRLLVRRGPRENSSRPAIDPLFRSVALAYGGQAIAVLLTGLLSDGVAGLIAVKGCGGVTVVQDPQDAEYPDLPRNALAMAPVDHVIPIAGMPGLLQQLVQQPPRPNLPPPPALAFEVDMAIRNHGIGEQPAPPGAPSPFTCPECGGALWQMNDGELTRFRCHLGHAFTLDVLDDMQRQEFERALATALRTLEERILVIRRIAADARRREQRNVLRHWENRLADFVEQAAQLRSLLMARRGGSKPEK